MGLLLSEFGYANSSRRTASIENLKMFMWDNIFDDDKAIIFMHALHCHLKVLRIESLAFDLHGRRLEEFEEFEKDPNHHFQQWKSLSLIPVVLMTCDAGNPSSEYPFLKGLVFKPSVNVTRVSHPLMISS
ncbi:hypothetical protein QQZ08_006951 [Neonectria magnoliae]|uniref:CHAT domain-containing protein n=1 Tax=Neonectria magnoliae TaxID=2732573 RepID=A0ABR1HZX7_9HYPO